MEQNTDQKQEQWAIVDLFGHSRVAGRISEHTFGGCSFVRVDIPAVDGRPAATNLYGQGAIYGIKFVTEEIARAAAKAFRVEPVTPYDLPQLRQRQLGLDADPDAESRYDD